jgi:hypothetical protein
MVDLGKSKDRAVMPVKHPGTDADWRASSELSSSCPFGVDRENRPYNTQTDDGLLPQNQYESTAGVRKSRLEAEG